MEGDRSDRDEKRIQKIHDKLFKTVFSRPQEAISFFREHLPENIFQSIGWDTLTPVDKEHMREFFTEEESDLLFQVRLKDTEQDAFLYILFEHQSTADKWMPFRMLKYSCWIWDLSFKLYTQQEKLPPVIPIVLYQGEHGWRHSTQFLDLFANAEVYRDFLPQYAFSLIDQSGCGEDDFVGTVIARIAQLLLWAAYHGEIKRLLELLGDLLPLVDDSGGGIRYYHLFFKYMLETHEGLTPERIKEGLQKAGPRSGEAIMTIADQLRAEGKAEGRLEAQLEAAKNLIENGVPLEVVQKSTGLTLEQLKEEGILKE